MNQEGDTDQEPLIPSTGCNIQIAELDGCMLPIMTANESEEDKRKNKKLHWQEARLGLVRQKEYVTPKFSCIFQGTTDEVGQKLYHCAIKAGFGHNTHVHGVGDGATWIAMQFSDKFGSQASYLVDFYHVCEYLNDASKTCASNNSKEWLNLQKDLLKNNEFSKVLENLKPFIEPETFDDKQAPVRVCHRYLSNRTNQLNYKEAIDKGFPIGSGEIESAHRYVIQKRLKLSGAWWKADNVNPMLSLRVLRANQEWEQYWENLAKVA